MSSARASSLPTFIGIGAPKCGTTTLFDLLRQVPQVFLSRQKELGYFVKAINHSKGEDWYASHFQEAPDHVPRGEFTPHYAVWPEAPEAAELMYQLVPNARLIYIMRHPVERAYSEYTQDIRIHPEYNRTRHPRLTFEDYTELYPSTLHRSNYVLQINRFLKFYRREQLLLLFFEDLRKDPRSVVARTLKHLGLETEPPEDLDWNTHSNQGGSASASYARMNITAPILRLPGARVLRRVLPQAIKNQAFRILRHTKYAHQISSNLAPSPLTEQTRARLLRYFRIPNEQLSQLTGADLAAWHV